MSLHSRLRRQMPYLTPPFAGDNEERLLGTMRDSIKPPDETKWIKTPEMVDPNTGINLRAAEGIVKEESAKPLPRVHLGVSTRGLQGVDKSIAELQAAKDYDREGLGFKITPEGVDMKPPDPHIDWKDRAKAGAKAAIISIANIRKANPDASVAEMLAGAATGGGIGLASPDTGNAMFRRAQIEDMEQRLGPQVRQARDVEQLEELRRKPQMEAEEVRRNEEHRRRQEEIQRAVAERRMSSDEADRELKRMELEEKRRQFDLSREDKKAKPDTAEFENEQIANTISQIEAEQKTLGPSPPTEIDDVTLVENESGQKVPTVTGKKVNPAYLDWARRYRELDDQKRQLQMKRKAPTLTRRDPSVQAYADKFFKGDVAAAEAAIKKQRGQ